MDADLDPLLASRLAEELARIPAPGPRSPRPRGRAVRMRAVIAVVAVLLLATVAGRELAVLRTPGAPAAAVRALYFGDPYGSGWLQIDPLTLADRGTKPLLDHKLSPDESVVSSADGSTIVVSHYGQLLADHSVYDARTGALRWQFTDQEAMVVDGISANGQEIIGRAGSANHSLTDAKLIVSTVNGQIVRRVPALDGCCVDAIAYDPSLTTIYYVLGPSFFTVDPPGLGPVRLLMQSTTAGATKAVLLPGIEAGRVLKGSTPESTSPETLYFAATVLSPDGTRFAALSLDGASLVVVDTATLQVTLKTLVRQTSWRDLFAPLVVYGKESADNDSWNAAFSADGKTLFAYHTQSFQLGGPGSAVYLQTLALERIDIERGAITAVAPAARPFTDYISDLVPSSDGQSLYVIQSGRLGFADRGESPYLRRLDARSLTVQAERPITNNAFDLREFESPRAAPTAASPAGTSMPSSISREEAIAVVRGWPEIGRVDRIEAKLMSFDEYVRIAGRVQTHPGDPRASAVTGFGITGDPAKRSVWIVAVSGEVWPNGRVPVFFGGSPPVPNPTPYPPYRWGMFLIDAVPGRVMTVGDAGISVSWPAVFDTLPDHPVAAYVAPSPSPLASALSVRILSPEAMGIVLRLGAEVRRVDRIELKLMTRGELERVQPSGSTAVDESAPVWVVAVAGEISPQLARGATFTSASYLVDANTGSIIGVTAGGEPWPPYFDALPSHGTQ